MAKSFLDGLLTAAAKAADKVIMQTAKERERQANLAEKERLRRDNELAKYQHATIKSAFGTTLRATTKAGADSINRGFRGADHNRWRQLDLVVGMEIKRSNNPDCNCELCEIAAGRYPKNFLWTGWHDGCKCIQVSILKTPDEMATDNAKIMRGEPLSSVSVNSVMQIPFKLKMYIKQHPELQSTDWYICNKSMFH